MSSKNVCDGLIRIKNGYRAGLKEIVLKNSSFIRNILEVLKQEGYVESYKEEGYNLNVKLCYRGGRAALIDLSLISKPGRRLYGSFNKLKFAPRQTRHFSCIILSTSQGIMAHHKAKKLGIGGQFIAEVI